MTTSFVVVVPARLASSRLPNKPLALIAGKPMVVWAALAAQRSGADRVLVASDAQAVIEVAQAAGLEAMLTSETHPSGTDRLAEVVLRLDLPDDTIVVNVQGDEPLIPPELIVGVAERLAHDPSAAIATAAHPIDNFEEFINPNVVKVVLNREGHASYFSRAPIPWARDAYRETQAAPKPLNALRHIGIYAYRVRFLKHYATLDSALTESLEALEQLRALWHGEKIAVKVVEQAPPGGVDTPEDLERVRLQFSSGR